MVRLETSLIVLSLLGCVLKIPATSDGYLTCDTQFREKKDNTNYVCPKLECPSAKPVYGTYYYTNDSRVCRAAWHDGRILPWSDNDTDRTVRWTACTDPFRTSYVASFRYGAGRSSWYRSRWKCKRFVSARKIEPLYRLSTLSSMGSGTVRVYGGINVDLATDLISASVYDARVSTLSASEVQSISSGLDYKEFRIHTGVNVFTATGSKTNLYSRIVSLHYGKIPLSKADQSSTLRLVSSSFDWTADAGKAIDGNHSTDFMNGKSCSHTLKRANLKNPWWRAELNGTFIVHGIHITSGKGSHDCKYTGLGKDYMGTVNTTHDETTCRMWKDTFYMDLHENYCRNPDGETGGPWCYVHGDPKWNYCSVSLCSDLSESLSDFQVRISNTSGTPQATSTDVMCKHYNSTISDATTVYIACDRPVSGRYIYIIKNGNSKSETLSLCEVEVFGTPAVAASSALSRRVSVGDRAIITFDGIEPSGVEWQKDNQGFYSGGYISSWQGSLTNSIDTVEEGHGGVYTIHQSSGEVLGITRLFVRVCRRGKFGGDCTNDCPQCENGGVCHDITGECICPPGFRGDICSIGCGGNRFGSNCSSSCSEDDREDGCRGMHVCTVDPYGCSCVAGFKGMACSQGCSHGYYGADCEQTCGHCDNNATCSPYTGHCPDGACAPGYMTFPYCRTGCSHGYYGADCEQTCGHCDNNATCSPYTGHCPDGACAPGYMTFPYCRTEIARLKQPPTVVSRTGQALYIRWTEWRNGTDHGVGHVEKYVVEYKQKDDKSWLSIEVVNMRNHTVYTCNISKANATQIYKVRISIKIGDDLCGNTSPEVEVCAEPETPQFTLSNREIDSVNITILVDLFNWRCGTPGYYVIEYINTTAGSTWNMLPNVTSSSTSLYTAACTTWRVRVRAFNKHMSSLSGEKTITSRNRAPGPVQNLTIHPSNTTSRSMMIVWKEPEDNGCSIKGYELTHSLVQVVQCADLQTGNEVKEILQSTRKHITALQPNSKYEIKVLAKTEYMGEERSIKGVTLEDAPSGVPQSVSTNASVSSAHVSWVQPNCSSRNGIITKYNLRLTTLSAGCSKASINNIYETTNTSFLFSNISSFTNYSVRVRACTTRGAGPWTVETRFTTHEQRLSGVQTLKTFERSGELQISWMSPPEDNGCQLKRYAWRYMLLSRSRCLGTSEPVSKWEYVNETQASLKVFPFSTYSIEVAPVEPTLTGPLEKINVTTKEEAPSTAPQNITIGASARSAHVSWLPPDCTLRNGIITNYSVRLTALSTGCSVSFVNATYKTVNTSVLLSNLSPFTNYSVILRAYTAIGPGPWTIKSKFRSREERLSRVKRIQTEERSGELHIQWTAPSEDDGCQLRGYVWRHRMLFRSQCPGTSEAFSNWTYVNINQTSLKVFPFSSYDIEVAPVGPTRTGLVEMRNVTTREEAPSIAPQNVSISASSRSAHVSWLPPDCTLRNGIITNYSVRLTTLSTGCSVAFVNITYKSVNTSVLLRNLSPFTNYSVIVQAYTTTGPGPWTIETKFMSHEERLSGVEKIRTGELNGELHIEWTWPAQDDGCQLRGYVWRYRMLSRSQCPGTSEAFSNWTCVNENRTSLKVFPFSSYVIEVAPVGPTRTGQVEMMNVTTQEEAPSTGPQNVSISASARSAHVSWLPPDCTLRNGIITNYSVRLTTLSTGCSVAFLKSTYTTVNTSIWLSNLSPFTNYSVILRAHTATGPGPWTIESTFSSQEERLREVQRLKTEELNDELHIKWTSPAQDDGCQLRGYVWRYRILSRSQCPGTSEVFSNWMSVNEDQASLKAFPFSSYVIEVAPVGPTLTGHVEKMNVTTQEKAPFAPPRNASLISKSNSSLSFTWDEVECMKQNGNVSNYRYSIRNENGPCVLANVYINQTGSRDITFLNLTPYTKYAFRVQASVRQLAGPWTDWINITTDQSAPTAPTNLSVVDSNPEAVKLSWNAPCPPRGKVTGYLVSYEISNKTDRALLGLSDNSTHQGNSTCENCTTITLPSLRPYVNYNFRVKARTVEWGEWSPFVEERIQESAPGEPDSLTCSTSLKQTSVTITWSQPLVKNGIILDYKIKWPQQKSAKTYNLSSVLSNLVAGTPYEIHVSARTSAGEGSSAKITCWTALPDVPKILMPVIKKEDMTEHSVKVVLSPPRGYPNKDNIKFYLVIVERAKQSSKRRRSYIDLDSKSLHGYADGTADLYITANLTTVANEQIFVIGDGKHYGGFLNGQLVTGDWYRFIFGIVMENDVVNERKEHYQYLQFEDMAEAGTHQVRNWKKERKDTVIGAGIGSFVAVLLVLVIIGLVFYRRRRQASKNPSASDQLPMHDISTNEGSSSHAFKDLRDTSQGEPSRPKEKSGPQTKPKGTAPPPAEPVYSNVSKPIPIDELDSYVARRLSEDNLDEEYRNLPSGLIFARDAALKEDNKRKNRFNNIVPYDKNRVVLHDLPNKPDSDFINASYIDGYKKPRAFIAAMGPNTHSVKDFWRMVWQENVTKIVMLTKPVENGKRKCEEYWPDSHEVERYGHINVTLTSKETKPDYITRTFEVLKVTTPKQHQSRELVHYHFTSWPDHDVPNNSSALWQFYRVVKGRIARDGDNNPTIIHCSAGVGRTGTFIMMDILSEQVRTENVVDILGQVYLLRQQRVNMVQTAAQYQFIHSAMVENIHCGDTFIPSKDFEKTLSVLFKEEKYILQKEFQTLQRLCPSCDPEGCAAGRLPVNANKNRFPQILPLGRARPYLLTPGGDGSTDYINAIFVNGFQHRDTFIVTQMPLPNTVFDFWRMMYDHDSSTIVMLNASDGDDKTSARYWAEEGAVQYGRFRIETVAKRFEHNELIIHRTFNFMDTKTASSPPRQIEQFELTNWPTNQRIPPSAIQPALIELYDLVENRLRKTDKKPATIHCLDGCTRSGFFCAMVNLFDKIKLEQGVDVFHTVKSTRSNRPEFVGDIEQYKSLYLMAQRFLESFETYANFR